MSNTYEINRDNLVIPYTSGRKCNDTRAWRNATDFEIQQAMKRCLQNRGLTAKI
jgi:hypothetical protein